MSAADAPHQRMFNLPTVTKWLLVANVVVFAVMAVLPDETTDAVVAIFGFTPARYHGSLSFAALFDPITYQFLHGGIEHVAVNMLGLAAFTVRPALRTLWGVGMLFVFAHCLVDYPTQQRPALAAFFFAMIGVLGGADFSLRRRL